MSAFLLTPLGKQMAVRTVERGPEFTVISTIYEADDEPVEFDEIADALKTDDEKASMLLNKLIRKEWIKTA